MKKSVPIGAKLAAIIAVPTLLAVVFAWQFLGSLRAEATLLAELSATTHCLKLVAPTANAVQKERSVSTIITDGRDGSDLYGSVRTSTDGALRAFREALSAAKLPAETKRSIDSAFDGLVGLRSQVDAGSTSRESVDQGYTALFAALLSVPEAAAKGNTSFGIGKMISSMILLEQSREAAWEMDGEARHLVQGAFDPEAAKIRLFRTFGSLETWIPVHLYLGRNNHFEFLV